MKIAVLGPKGTFSDMAYAEYVSLCVAEHGEKEPVNYEPVYYPTIDEVFFSVADSREADAPLMGIVPIENTLDGYVMRTLDLLLEKEVHIVDEAMVPVAFSLVGNVSSVDGIRVLYVQYKAHGQCRQFINSLKNVKIINTESNMESYYRIEDEPGAAAIVPTHIAKEEQNRFVRFDVTDSDYNHTRFVVFTRGCVEIGAEISGSFSVVKNTDYSSHNAKVRIPVYILPKEEHPGLLYDILKNFYDSRINLISIMSRPTKHELGTYNFYIEIDALRERLRVVYDTLQLVKQNNKMKLLGVYPESFVDKQGK